MNNLPLQPLKWGYYQGATDFKEYAKGANYTYLIILDRDKYTVSYYKPNDIAQDEKGFATIDEAKQWAWSHYNEKMQPYVKPMPTWIDASEQLPSVDTDTQFICAYDSAIDTFSKVVWFNADIGEFNYQHDDVLAWMPIPEFSTMQNLHKGASHE